MAKARVLGVGIHLPLDFTIAPRSGTGATYHIDCGHKVPYDMMIMDCGPKTIAMNAIAIRDSKTIIWSGPMGHYNVKRL